MLWIRPTIPRQVFSLAASESTRKKYASDKKRQAGQVEQPEKVGRPVRIRQKTFQ